MVDRKLSSMDDGDAGDDRGAEWSSLREMIGAARASGFDEEPSPRIDALLMAAARAHAPRPRVAWWSRLASWMRPLVVHPALAGAAALVIVGGAAGVMYKRGQFSVGPPRLAQTVPAPRPDPDGVARPGPSGVAVAQPPAPSDEPVLPSTTLSGVPPEVMAPELPKPTPGPRRPQRERGLTTGAPEVVADGFERGAAGGGSDSLVIAADRDGPPWEARKNAALDDDSAGEDQGERETIAQATEADNAFSARVGGVAPAGATHLRLEESRPTAPPPPSDPAPQDRQTNLRDAGGGAAVTAGTADRRRDEQNRTQLLGQARTAAKSGNCGAVKTIGERVRKLDATYYRDVFARDADIAKCL